jgi:hypothetical protein
MRRLLPLVCAVPLLGGCGGGDELDTGTQQEIAFHANGVVVAHQALTAIDQTMEIDPTLDVTKTPEQNAVAIQQRAAEGGTCVDASVSGATATIIFAAGCDVRGTAISGQLSLTVQKTAGTITVTANFAALEVGGVPLDGSAKLMTAGDGSYQVTFDLTSGDSTVGGQIALEGAPGQVTLSGTLTSGGTSRSSSTELDNVVYVIGDCYPAGGALTIVTDVFNGTITFLATTPQDGVVAIQRDRRTTTAPLPAYGSCPPA